MKITLNQTSLVFWHFFHLRKHFALFVIGPFDYFFKPAECLAQ